MSFAAAPSIRQALRHVAGLLAQGGRQRSAARRVEFARLSSRVLTKGASVHVLRWEGEELLVGCTDQSMVVLARRPADGGREEGA